MAPKRDTTAPTFYENEQIRCSRDSDIKWAPRQLCAESQLKSLAPRTLRGVAMLWIAGSPYLLNEASPVCVLSCFLI